jgi:hypothetical protein
LTELLLGEPSGVIMDFKMVDQGDMILIFYTTFFEEMEYEVPFANVMHFIPAHTEIGMIEHHNG